MAKRSTEQPNSKKFNLPSLHHREEAQISSFIQRGLHLAHEIEANLEISAQHLAPKPSLSSDPHGSSAHGRSAASSYTPELADTLEAGTLEITEIQDAVLEQTDQPIVETEEASWAMVWLHRGFCKYQQADYVGAKDNFQQALQKQPTLAAAYNGLGSVYYQNQDFVESALAYHQGLEYAPQIPELYCNLGSALYQIQHFDDAALAYQQAIHFNPYLQLAYYGLGLAQHRIGFLEEAVTAFEQATQLNNQHPESFLGLAAILYDLKEYADASLALRQATHLNPSYLDSYWRFLNIQSL